MGVDSLMISITTISGSVYILNKEFKETGSNQCLEKPVLVDATAVRSSTKIKNTRINKNQNEKIEDGQLM